MAVLGSSQRPIVMPHYPHMMSEDVEVWSKFLALWGDKLKEVWYDVHVGASNVHNLSVDPLVKSIAAGVTRKRIDVICKVGGGYWVIEVKPFASMLALGQVVSYTGLFVREYEPDGETIPVIVCDSYDDDLLDEFEELGVVVIQND